MKLFPVGLGALMVAALPLVAQGQMPPPGRPLSPVLFVRFVGPTGARVTTYTIPGQPRVHAAPVAVGLRPGYTYRVKVDGMERFPGVELFPTVQVYNSIALPPKQNPADHPAIVPLSDLDVERAAAGALVTKVIYLEDPEKASPTASTATSPPESDLAPDRDPVVEARSLGRVVAIVRLGGRRVSDQELFCQAIPGTMLIPGEAFLPPPPVPPFFPWHCLSLTDPIAGPRRPEEECLRDGGDVGIPAGIGADGKAGGVDPSDTVAEYSDSLGRRKLTISNRVCLCVPRFGVVRTELPLGQYDNVVGLGAKQATHGRVEMQGLVPSRLSRQSDALMATRGRERPSAAVGNVVLGKLLHLEALGAIELLQGPMALIGTDRVHELTALQRARLLRGVELALELTKREGPRSTSQSVGTMVLGRREGLGLIEAHATTRELLCCCDEPPRAPDKPLCLYKWVNAQAAKIGDVVTFHIKYSNHGGQPITDVAVVDSLTGRLEYVPGSARSDRAAVFTLQENSAGSVVLRWEVSGKLLPGESGSVSFQALVR